MKVINIEFFDWCEEVDSPIWENDRCCVITLEDWRKFRDIWSWPWMPYIELQNKDLYIKKQ